MSFARKMRRKGLNKTSCCGGQMLHKVWDDNYDFYVCGRCGKEKRIKNEAENAGDNDNCDNMRNIGDDLMDQ